MRDIKYNSRVFLWRRIVFKMFSIQGKSIFHQCPTWSNALLNGILADKKKMLFILPSWSKVLVQSSFSFFWANSLHSFSLVKTPKTLKDRKSTTFAYLNLRCCSYSVSHSCSSKPKCSKDLLECQQCVQAVLTLCWRTFVETLSAERQGFIHSL